MTCELCGKDPNVVMLLPLHQPDGKLCIMVCEECGKASSAYCTDHETIHQGFMDGSTACIPCIEKLVSEHSHQAEEMYSALKRGLPELLWDVLDEVAEVSSDLTSSPKEISILRFLATKAKRSGEPVEDILAHVVSKRSIAIILS